MRYIVSLFLFFYFLNGLHSSIYAETPQPKTAKDITRKPPKVKSLIDAKDNKAISNEDSGANSNIDDAIEKIVGASENTLAEVKKPSAQQKNDTSKTIVKHEKTAKEKDIKNPSPKNVSLKDGSSKNNLASKNSQQKDSIVSSQEDEKQKEADEKDDETDIDSHVVTAKGSPQKLPLPRFVSLKSNAVNMHVGPGDQYPVEWRYTKQFLPVEIISEFDHWRQIRDSQGTVGWVHKILLSGKRFVMIQNKVVELYKDVKSESSVMATVEPGVVAKLVECNAHLCCVDIQGIRGWVKRDYLFGVYPDETKF